jgi:hypothetical protein
MTCCIERVSGMKLLQFLFFRLLIASEVNCCKVTLLTESFKFLLEALEA